MQTNRTVQAAAWLLLTSVAAGQSARNNPLVECVAHCRPAVVTVKVGTRNGSGFIVREDGIVLTARHVVKDQKVVKVITVGGAEFNAEKLAEEETSDLAILQIRPQAGLKAKLPVLPIAKPGDLLLGETVMAIGAPYGYEGSVTLGIVSAKSRDITMPSGVVIAGMIQTSAAINPGSSGGPLINMDGEVVGMATSYRDGSSGIAFAVNADDIMKMLRKYKVVTSSSK